jgi:hypothetical protein
MWAGSEAGPKSPQMDRDSEQSASIGTREKGRISSPARASTAGPRFVGNRESLLLWLCCGN